jgi:CheY-like chemotaxis protein
MVSESKTAVKVLVADDDEVFLEILAETVESAGAGVVLAPDGLAALEHLAAAEFDILITDLNMPRMDGMALLRHVRSTYPHILSILVTGFGSLESAIEALRLGVYDYIQKPFMVEQVAVTIRNAIERVLIFREKVALLEKVETLNKRLYLLEGKRNPEYEIYDNSGHLIGGPLYLDPGNFRSDAFLDRSSGNPNRVIVALETLKGLKRDGVISELELERLKRVIIKRIESARP